MLTPQGTRARIELVSCTGRLQTRKGKTMKKNTKHTVNVNEFGREKFNREMTNEEVAAYFRIIADAIATGVIPATNISFTIVCK